MRDHKSSLEVDKGVKVAFVDYLVCSVPCEVFNLIRVGLLWASAVKVDCIVSIRRLFPDIKVVQDKAGGFGMKKGQERSRAGWGRAELARGGRRNIEWLGMVEETLNGPGMGCFIAL